MGKQGFYARVDQAEEADSDYAADTIAMRFVAGDVRIGVPAFLEKKEPTWAN